MGKKLVVLSLLSVLFAPLVVCAETEDSSLAQRRLEIHQLAVTIMGSTFQPLQMKTHGATPREALVKMGLSLRAHLSSRNISPLMCRCLHAVSILTNPEYALLEHWGYTVNENGDGSSMVVMTFEPDQLTQYALLNMWPLLLPNFMG